MKGVYARMDTLGIVQKRLELIFAAKVRERSRLYNAVQTQDRLRAKSKNWNGTEEIRKWRDQR